MCSTLPGGVGVGENKSRERGRCTLIAKRENVTTPSINAACLSSVEFTWEAEKKLGENSRSYARYFSPWGPLSVLWRRAETEAIHGNHRPCWTDCPWQVRSDSVWATKAHSHPQKNNNKKKKHKKKFPKLHNKTNIRFDSVNWIRQASASTLCKHFHHMLHLAMRKAFTCLWHKITLIHVWRVGKKLANTREWL